MQVTESWVGSGNKAMCGNVNVKMDRFTLGTIKCSHDVLLLCVCVLCSWCIHIEVVYLLTICSTHAVCSASMSHLTLTLCDWGELEKAPH